MLVLDFLVVFFNHALGSALVAWLRVNRPLDPPSSAAVAARCSPTREAAYRRRVLRCASASLGAWVLLSLLLLGVSPYGATQLRVTGVQGAPRVDPAAGAEGFWAAWRGLGAAVAAGVAAGGGAPPGLVVLGGGQLAFDPTAPLPGVGWYPGNASALTAAAGGALVSAGCARPRARASPRARLEIELYTPAFYTRARSYEASLGAPPSVLLLRDGAALGVYQQNHATSFVAPQAAPNFGVYDAGGGRLALSTACVRGGGGGGGGGGGVRPPRRGMAGTTPTFSTRRARSRSPAHSSSP